MRLALVALALVALPACDDAGDLVDRAACDATGHASEGTVSATADGARFSATCVRGDVTADVLSVAGIDDVVSDGRQRSVALVVAAAPGAYSVGADGVTATYVARADDPDRQPEQTFAAVAGTVTVEAVSDAAAEGTFAFTARNADGDEVEVTGGRFEVEF
jgi:hypothetical protein